MAHLESEGTTDGIRKVRILRYRDGSYNYLEDSIAAEEPLEILVAYGWHAPFKATTLTMRTMGNDYNLAVGFLLSEGFIFSKEDLLEFYKEGEHRIFFRLVEERAKEIKSKNHFSNSACGVCSNQELKDLNLEDLSPLPKTIRFRNLPFEKIIHAMLKEQSIFSTTGGIHCSALVDDQGDILYQAEDIGRHNTVDKLVGQCLEKKYAPQDCFLLVSGRCGFEIIQKVAKAKISVVLSIGAPSSLAVELADWMNICIVGFLKKNQHNIYTHPFRVLETPLSKK